MLLYLEIKSIVIIQFIVTYASLLISEFTDPGIVNKEIEYMEFDKQMNEGKVRLDPNCPINFYLIILIENFYAFVDRLLLSKYLTLQVIISF
jgi:hypothetical protein